jgi:hypothetical protein
LPIAIGDLGWRRRSSVVTAGSTYIAAVVLIWYLDRTVRNDAHREALELLRGD